MTLKWKDLELGVSIIKTLKELNFKSMTPVQRRPEKWKNNEVGAIVISPTRELAAQISDVLSKFLKNIPELSQVLIMGGDENKISDDIAKLTKSVNIIIATPGRLNGILTECKEINLQKQIKNLEILILDEADRLLDLGFYKDVNSILSHIPRLRRTGLFSATQTKELQELIRAGLRNPALVSVKEKSEISTPSTLHNNFCIANPDTKLASMISFITMKGTQLKYIVFFSTCACVDYFSHIIKALLPSTNVFALHGKIKGKRSKIFEDFREAKNGLLVCTDVMARGVDIPEVDWVLQYDPPSTASTFVHRCGRTARIGNEGSALLFLLESEEAYKDFIEMNKKVTLEEIILDPPKETVEKCLSHMRNAQKKDRLLFDKANRAFVSYIQAYTKHECSLILCLKDLDIGKCAMGFGLLKMPRMPELKGRDVSTFCEEEVDINSIGYKHHQRETIRLKKLEEYKNTGVWPKKKDARKPKNTVPWAEAKKLKVEKKEKKNARKEKLKKKMENHEGLRVKKKNNKRISEEDILQLEKDIASMKRFKKKKISQEELDKELGVE